MELNLFALAAMKRSLLSLLALATLAIVFGSGCYSTEQGNLKFGSPVGQDSIVSRYERPLDQVRNATIVVLKRNGTLIGDDRVRNVLTARVDRNTVWVGFDASEPKIVKVTTQARGPMGGPDVTLAAEIDKQIYGELIVTGP